MDCRALQTVPKFTAPSSHFPSNACIRPSIVADSSKRHSPKLPHKRASLISTSSSSPYLVIQCSSETNHTSSCSNGVGGTVSDTLSEKFLQVVIISPQIPGTAGCIARTCAASAVGLHLVEPLGFQVADAKLKRAGIGLHYWPYVVVKIHASWEDFKDYFRQQDGKKRLLAFTKRGETIHSDFSFKRGDWLVFGSETCGLPPEILHNCRNERYGGGTIRIPMVETHVEYLNLAVSVGVAVYEASRQLGYEQIQSSHNSFINSQEAFTSGDTFA